MFDKELEIINWSCTYRFHNQTKTNAELYIEFNFNDDMNIMFVIDYDTLTHEYISIFIGLTHYVDGDNIINEFSLILSKFYEYTSVLTDTFIPYFQILKFTNYTEVESDGTKSIVTDAVSIIDFAIKVYKYAAESNNVIYETMK